MMIRTLGLLFAAFLCAGSVAAQEIDVSKIYLGTPTLTSGTGSPEGVHAAPPSSVYLRTDTGDWWRKATGTGTTGWVLMALSGSGTSGTLPKWTDTTTLGNSIITDSGTGINVAGTFRSRGGLADLAYATGAGTSTVTIGGGATQDQNALLQFLPSTSATNWELAVNTFATGRLDIVPSTTGGGSTFTTPALSLTPTVLTIYDTITSEDYVSQLTGWRIDGAGAADFRYVFVDEMHAKAFIADLEQALAGGQIIAKSVAMVAQAFTAPAASGTQTLWVRDLPSAPDMAAFESGDTVVLRTFSRAAGSLTIADCIGVVTLYADGSGANAGQQSWTFTRNAAPNAGSMTASTVVAVDSLTIDYGVTGNGFYEVSAIDGAYGINSPYAQIITWATAPTSANKTLRARFGNLRGVTSVTNEFGVLAGTYAASNGQYFRASNEAFELHGINLAMWDGATNVIKLDRTAPSFALGSPVPSAYGTGVGVWMGKDTSYKFRVGDPAGGQLAWDGSTLKAAGWTIGAANIYSDNQQVQLHSGAAGSAYVLVSDGVANNAALVSGSLSSDIALFVGGLIPNRATSSFRVTYAGALTATSATITGNITADTLTANTAGTIAGWTIGASSLTGGNATLASSGNLTLGTGNDVVRLSADDATYRLWIGNATAGSATFRVSKAGVVTATGASISGDITTSNLSASGGSITGGTIDGATVYAGSGNEVTLDSNGITITTGTSGVNRVKWSGGAFIQENTSSVLHLESDEAVTLNTTAYSVGLSNGHASFEVVSGSVSLGSSGVPWTNLWTNGTIRFSGLSGGSGDDFVCIDADGDLYRSATTCDGSLPQELVALRREVADLRILVAQLTAATR